jgi:hypothetical protein
MPLSSPGWRVLTASVRGIVHTRANMLSLSIYDHDCFSEIAIHEDTLAYANGQNCLVMEPFDYPVSPSRLS